MNRFARCVVTAAVLASPLAFSGCSTSPKGSDQAAFKDEAAAAERWFTANVPGLRNQLNGAAGYVVFPSVGQWGIVFGGGQFGRGTVKDSSGTQIGWGAVNTGSMGLQAGVRGFKMLVVFQDQATLNQFKQNKLSGKVGAVVVVSDVGTSATAPFSNGVAIYEGASSGLMGGVNIGLEYMRYKPMGDDR